MSCPPRDVAHYYDAKTERLLRRYGPGPDVHYHSGIADDDDLRRVARGAQARPAMVRAQRRLVSTLGASLGSRLSGRLLDAGCGLGGPAIQLLAEGHVDEVTGLTLSEEHPAIAAALADQAGVGGRARFLTADVHALGALASRSEGASPAEALGTGHRAPRSEATDRFDCVLCLESSCYFDRWRFFAAMDQAVSPAGFVHLVDCFAGDLAVKDSFDRYWKTDLATVEDVVRDAALHGWQLDDTEAFGDRCFRFWDLTAQVLAAEAAAAEGDDEEQARLRRSRLAHARLRTQFESGAIDYRRLTFRRGAG